MQKSIEKSQSQIKRQFDTALEAWKNGSPTVKSGNAMILAELVQCNETLAYRVINDFDLSAIPVPKGSDESRYTMLGHHAASWPRTAEMVQNDNIGRLKGSDGISIKDVADAYKFMRNFTTR